MKQINMTQENFLTLNKAVRDYEYQLFDWYPTIDELEETIDFNDSENIPFLLFLSNTEMELTQDEKEAKEYIRNFLSQKINLKEGKRIE